METHEEDEKKQGEKKEGRKEEAVVNQMMQLNMKVNGTRQSIMISPDELLLNTLRNRLNLTGTKEGCARGECGACTVLVNNEPICSCITFSMQCKGTSVITIEGLSKEGVIHPIQKAFVDAGAVQCGYCTPGMILAAYSLLLKTRKPTEAQIRQALAGNLCRCTGYTKIVKAITTASERLSGVDLDPHGTLSREVAS